MDFDLREYLDEYLVELDESLSELNTKLLRLESEPGDPTLINDIFRTVHTIKGNAGTMGFSEINRIAHAMEDVLGDARAGSLIIQGPLIDTLLEAYDHIETLKKCIVSGSTPELPIDATAAKLRSYLPAKVSKHAGRPSASPRPPGLGGAGAGAAEGLTSTPTAGAPAVAPRPAPTAPTPPVPASPYAPGPGPTGPTGPTGPAGPTGSAGPHGAPGAAPPRPQGPAHPSTSPADGARATAASAAPPSPPLPPSGGGGGTQGEGSFYILLDFDPELVMKGVRAFLVINRLRDAGKVLESVPTAREIEDNVPFDVLLIKLISKAPEAKIRRILEFGEAREIKMLALGPDLSSLPLSALATRIHGAPTPPTTPTPQSPAAPVGEQLIGEISQPTDAAPATRAPPPPQAAAPLPAPAEPASPTHPIAPLPQWLASSEPARPGPAPAVTQAAAPIARPADTSPAASAGSPDALSRAASPDLPGERPGPSASAFWGGDDIAAARTAASSSEPSASVSQPVRISAPARPGGGGGIGGGGAAGSEDASIAEMLAGLSEDVKTAVVEAINHDQNVVAIEVRFPDGSENNRVRAMALLNQARGLGRMLFVAPTKEDLDRGDFVGVLNLVLESEREAPSLRSLLSAQDGLRVRVDTLVLDGVNLVSLEERGQQGITRGRTKVAAAPATERKPAVGTVRVTVDRLDALMNLVGELVIAKTQFLQVLARYQESGDAEALQTSIKALLQKLTWITDSLQGGIMKVRMVQIGTVFSRFGRLVRDLSKVLGKQIELTMEGSETELDKTVIDEIGEPLLHLIRNAVDHGIEPADVRKALGKPERGTLALRAQQVGDHIIVETTDDGSGLDFERLRNRAIDLQLGEPEAIKSMSDAEAADLIFLPGFSTASRVSDISGRGVGMDVVKQVISNLSGDIQIRTEKNQGTTFQIKLPLTLAIIEGLLVKSGEESFAIPLSTVKETIPLESSMLHLINNQKVVEYREEVIPLIDLESLFDLAPSPSTKRFIVFAGDDDNKIGIVVNSLVGRREIVIKSLDKRHIRVRTFAGATILGDGRVCLILDVPALIEEARSLFA